MYSKEIIELIERKIPTTLQMNFDNSGLQIGPFKREIKKIMLTLDISYESVKSAIDKECDMLISHHPMFFKSLKKVDISTDKGKIIELALKNDLTIYSIHTPIDIFSSGLNDYFCELISADIDSHIMLTGEETIYKYQVFVPVSHREAVIDAISKAGGGFIGNYSDCTFSTNGVGTFLPLEGTNPYIGSIGKRENVEEFRIESVITGSGLNNLINSVLKVHPYEEVAYEVFPLKTPNFENGVGRFAHLNNPVKLCELIEKTSVITGQRSVNYTGNEESLIRKIAVCTGDGASLLDKVIGKCDVYISGDFKYHDFQFARENGLNIIEINHDYTEKYFPEVFKKIFNDLEVEFMTFNGSYYNTYRR